MKLFEKAFNAFSFRDIECTKVVSYMLLKEDYFIIVVFSCIVYQLQNVISLFSEQVTQ